MTKFNKKGKNCFSVFKGDIEYYFEYISTSETMPRFLQLKIGDMQIPIIYDISEMVESATSLVIFKGGTVSSIIVSTNLPARERDFKSKTIEILKAIDIAIEKAEKRNCLSQNFQKSTDSEIEEFAQSITRHKNRTKIEE